MQGVTLDTLGSGALGELFAEELARVLANIHDPNTDPTVKRKIAIEVTFKPKKDREVSDVDIKCTSRIAPIVTVSTQLFIGKHQGKFIAVENDPRQGSFFDQEQPTRPLAAVANFSNSGGTAADDTDGGR